MKKSVFLFYIAVIGSSFFQYNAFAGKEAPSDSMHTRADAGNPGTLQQPTENIVVCDGGATCSIFNVPKRPPKCICIMDYIFKQGKETRLMYKTTGRERGFSVPIKVVRINDQFTRMLDATKDKKIFLDGRTSRLKGNEWRVMMAKNNKAV